MIKPLSKQPIAKQLRIKQLKALTLLLTGVLTTLAIADDYITINDLAPRAEPRIVGGVPTSINQVPATVALLRSPRVQLDGDLFQAQFCGGTAITTRWILTAAHCVANGQGGTSAPDQILVLVGSDDLDNPTNQPIEVQRIITHPNYESVEQGSDIALLQLTVDAPVQPIVLDTQPISINDQAFIAGWGAVNTGIDGSNQNFPQSLRGTFVNMTPGAQCASFFPAYTGYTNDTNICAGIATGGRDACQGDSGGPMYRVNDAGTHITALTGITSWGISCGVAEHPGIYTNTAAFADWIETTLRIVDEQIGRQGNGQPENDGANADDTNDQIAPLPGEVGPAGSLVNPEDENEHVLGGALAMGLLLLLTAALLRYYFMRCIHRR